MRKFLIFFVIVFSCNSLLYAELKEEQIWAIALTGIMTERNRSNRNTLNADEMNGKNKDKWLEVLKRDWDINNRTELLETLENTENNGHASALRNTKLLIEEMMNSQGQSFNIFDIINKYELSQRYYNYLKYVMLNWNIYKNRTILAWDLGRCISLCRWGYQVGFMTEEEAWEKIMYYARKTQTLYSSWNEYGYDYYMGRVFWASGFGEDTDYLKQTDPIYKKLLSSYWHKINWRTDLSA
jgi:hypothetical protein